MNIQKLLNTDMSRKQFLLTLWMLFIAVVGVNKLIERVMSVSELSVSKFNNQSPMKPTSFGSGPYGV